jgi:hypothetical protein
MIALGTGDATLARDDIAHHQARLPPHTGARCAPAVRVRGCSSARMIATEAELQGPPAGPDGTIHIRWGGDSANDKVARPSGCPATQTAQLQQLRSD